MIASPPPSYRRPTAWRTDSQQPADRSQPPSHGGVAHTPHTPLSAFGRLEGVHGAKIEQDMTNIIDIRTTLNDRRAFIHPEALDALTKAVTRMRQIGMEQQQIAELLRCVATVMDKDDTPPLSPRPLSPRPLAG